MKENINFVPHKGSIFLNRTHILCHAFSKENYSDEAALFFEVETEEVALFEQLEESCFNFSMKI